MRKLLLITLTIAALAACRKKSVAVVPCQSDAATVGNLLMKNVTVHKNGNSFVLVPENSIDQWYNPCNLPSQYAVDNKKLVIDAEVKETPRPEGTPCCSEDIVISKLAER